MTKIFFATDIHGSEVCFKKFIRAATFYDVDVAILGGDLSGKMIIPINRLATGGYRFYLAGRHNKIANDNDLSRTQDRLRDLGFYSCVFSPEEAESFKNPGGEVQNLFHKLIAERLGDWVLFADKRTKDLRCEFFWMPGNDDFYFVDEILSSSSRLTNCDHRLIPLPHGYELLSLGYSTPTPWHTPREKSETEIQCDLQALTAKVAKATNCIFNIHVPPFRSGLDEAPALDPQLRVLQGPAGAMTRPVGSTAVRTAVEACEPLLGLFGHVHESRDCKHLGATFCVNPGSVYSEGMLRGCVISLRGGKVADWQFTEG